MTDRFLPTEVRLEGETVFRADDPTESGGDDFAPLEEELAGVLSAAYLAKVAEIEPGLEDCFPARKASDDFAFDAERLAGALAAAEPIMEDILTAQDEAIVKKVLSVAMKKGAAKASAAELLEAFARRDELLMGMVRAAKYYSNGYFNKIVIPGIMSEVTKVLESGMPNDASAYQAIRAAMSKRLKSVPYWDVVANAAVSRGYHYGMVRGGLQAGFTGYRYVAVMDNRTTLLCKSLNGKTFWLADAVDLMERVAAADPEEVKTISPWENARHGLTEAEIRSRATIIPPMHGRCRSTIELLY